MSRVLGIDYGERRIGLALSDPLGIIAKPLKVIDRKTTPDYKSEIIEIIDEKEVIEIIVGLPITMKGDYSEQTKAVQKFIDEISGICNIPVTEIDERFSSIAAKKALHEQGVKTGHEKGRVDETAAAIILQEFLDSQS